MSTISPTPPTAPAPIRATATDEQHLKLLSIFYYVWAGLSAAGGCIGGVVYLGLGLAMALVAPDMLPTDEGPPPPPWLGWAIAGAGGFVLVLSLGVAVLAFLVGRFLPQLRHRTFCLVMAGVTCLSVPLGTVLGVFTFVVLLRPSVQQAFAGERARAAG